MVAFSVKDSDKKVIYLLYDYLCQIEWIDVDFEKHFSKGFYVVVFKYKGSDFNEFLDNFSYVIASFILRYYEHLIVKYLINTDYCYFEKNEKLVIEQEFGLLNKPNIVKSNRKLICKLTKSYAMQNSFFVFRGFICFALSDYISVLKELVQESVNQFIIDKEYLRFVDMLRDYIRNSVCKTSTIHLLYLNNIAYLIDDDGKDIALDDFSRTFVSDISFSKNDYVLNTLVGMAPSKVVIHLLSPADQFIRTIQLIFENRAILCTSCDICENYKKSLEKIKDSGKCNN